MFRKFSKFNHVPFSLDLSLFHRSPCRHKRFPHPSPKVGMNLGKLEGAGAKVKIMDVGGTVAMRPLWERYYSDIHGIAFVVDVSSTSPMSKIMESRAFYRCMRDDESLAKV